MVVVLKLNGSLNAEQTLSILFPGRLKFWNEHTRRAFGLVYILLEEIVAH